MPGQKVKKFLEENNIQYEVIKHSPTYSAQNTAHTVHVHGKDMIKTVIIKIDGKLTMLALTANEKINYTVLKLIFENQEVELASENEFKNYFPDCETGAMPPFGKLYGMDEIISKELTKDEEIVFNAGSHTELIRMKFHDYDHLIHPRVVDMKNYHITY